MAARGMDGRPTNRLAAPCALGLGPRHAGAHSLLYHRVLEFSEHADHHEHRPPRGGRGIEPLLVQEQLDLGFTGCSRKATRSLSERRRFVSEFAISENADAQRRFSVNSPVV
jgi:hypothetical protein